MGVAISIQEFLDKHHLGYETIGHPHTESSLRSASVAHLPGEKVAKSVLLKDGKEYMLAVLPADRHLHLGKLHKSLHRQVGLASEGEISAVFPDCALGAVPPTGLLYGLDTVVDDHLLDQPDIYFEAGDHERLIHMNRREFGKLMGDAVHGEITELA